MTVSSADLLSDVNDAIQTLLQGGVVKEYEKSGRRLERYDLKELMDLRSTLQSEVAAGSGTVNYVDFESPI